MLLLESKVFSPLLHPQFLCPLVCKTPPFPHSVSSLSEYPFREHSRVGTPYVPPEILDFRQS